MKYLDNEDLVTLLLPFVYSTDFGNGDYEIDLAYRVIKETGFNPDAVSMLMENIDFNHLRNSVDFMNGDGDGAKAVAEIKTAQANTRYSSNVIDFKPRE
jgi:hypothetical protein